LTLKAETIYPNKELVILFLTVEPLYREPRTLTTAVGITKGLRQVNLPLARPVDFSGMAVDKKSGDFL
jgi:hypothetical protein